MTGQRKQRSDKKRPIAPYIPDLYMVWIVRISARMNHAPTGLVGTELVRAAIEDEECIEFFSRYFKRSFAYTENRHYIGHKDAADIQDYLSVVGERRRLKIKAERRLAAQLDEFQIALGTPYLAHATYALLKYALGDIRIIRKLAPEIEVREIRGSVQPVMDLERHTSAWSILK